MNQKYKYQMVRAGLVTALLFFSITASAASCAGGAGTTITGVDNQTYCQSKIQMNWWSAFAWCEGAGLTLVSLEDCNGSNGTITGDASCPNFKEKGSGSVWTSSVPDGSNAYYIDLSSGTVSSYDRLGSWNGIKAALCK